MKKVSIISLIALFAIMLNSCKPNPEKIIKKNIKTYINNNMDNPECYEFVSLSLIDSMTYKNIIEERKNVIEKSIESYKYTIKICESPEFPEYLKDTCTYIPVKKNYDEEKKREISLDNYFKKARIIKWAKAKENIKYYYLMIQKKEKMLKSYDSIMNAMGENVNRAAYYDYLYKCRYNREKNYIKYEGNDDKYGLKRKTLIKYQIQVSPPEYRIISFTENFYEMHPYPAFHKVVEKLEVEKFK